MPFKKLLNQEIPQTLWEGESLQGLADPLYLSLSYPWVDSKVGSLDVP